MARNLPIRLRTIAAAAVVIATGLIIWNAYQAIINTTDPTSQTLPIIEADKKPFRVLPENPGGAEIPNQGSRLYNVLNAENSDDLALNGVKIDREEEPETIASSPETDKGFELPEIPETRRESLYNDLNQLRETQKIAEDTDLEVMEDKNREELKDILKTAIEDVEDEIEELETVAESDEAIQEDVAEALSSEPTEIDEVEIEKEEEQQTNIIVPVPQFKPANVSKTISQSRPSQRVTPTPPVPSPSRDTNVTEAPKDFSIDRILSKAGNNNGTHYIQLASLKSEADARQTYGRIRDDFPQLVEGVSVVFPKADLGSRGTFYRIQIGPMTVGEAAKRCENYRAKARGGTCLVVAR